MSIASNGVDEFTLRARAVVESFLIQIWRNVPAVIFDLVVRAIDGDTEFNHAANKEDEFIVEWSYPGVLSF